MIKFAIGSHSIVLFLLASNLNANSDFFQLVFIHAFRAKINNKSELGLGYQQKLRDGVTLTLSSLVNTGTFSAVSILVIIVDQGSYGSSQEPSPR